MKNLLNGTAILLIGLAMVATPPTFAADNNGPIVTTDHGAIIGGVEDGIEVFKGIPFAAPPVGELRWRAPQLAASWKGVRPATAYGPSCMQDAATSRMLGTTQLSEDCLYLNVWKPAGKSAKPKAVMVWLFGGAFRGGSGSAPFTAGNALAQQDVLVVAPNARVARFGYFSHPALTHEGGDGGLLSNYGLMDSIAALKWVRSNIAKFGGDPNNVTIFGVSSGGVTVSHLMASPLAKGLFQKAIIESGLGHQILCARDTQVRVQIQEPDCIATPEGGVATAEQTGAAWAQSMGLPANADAAALRAIPAEKVLSGPAALPVIDGKVILKNVSESFARSEQAQIPLMIGANSGEETILLYSGLSLDPQMAVLGTNRAKVEGLYMANGATQRGADEHIFGEAMFAAPARYLARHQSHSGKPTYLYHFAYVRTAEREKTKTASHGAEVGFVFKTIGRKMSAPTLAAPTEPSPEDWKMSDAISGYWVSFAKTGNPNGTNRPQWPSYDPKSDKLMAFTNEGPIVEAGFGKERFDMLEQSFTEYLNKNLGRKAIP